MNPYIEVNNNAIKLLHYGNYEAAVPTFLLALDLFKKQVAANAIKESELVNPAFDYGYGPNSSVDARMARRKRTQQIPRDHGFYQSHCFCSDELAAMTTKERLHFYNRAFLLSEGQEDDPAAMNRRDGTSALILFNIGVSLHAQAVRTGDSGTLEKGLTVYRLALSSAEHWALYSGGTQSLLQMSILSNMALLHSQLMQIEDSTIYLRSLRQLIVESPDPALEDRSVFDWNVVLFMEGRLGESPAPAA